jgi:hypothetical protein
LKRAFVFYQSIFFCCILFWTCTTGDTTAKKDSILHCTSNIPNRFGVGGTDTLTIVKGVADKTGMVFIKGGNYAMGASDKTGRADEYPQHNVTVSSFWMDTSSCPRVLSKSSRMSAFVLSKSSRVASVGIRASSLVSLISMAQILVAFAPLKQYVVRQKFVIDCYRLSLRTGRSGKQLMLWQKTKISPQSTRHAIHVTKSTTAHLIVKSYPE